MQQVAIIGHKSLLGAHLVKAFNDTLPDVKKNLWDYGINSMETLPTALQNCDLVFNLHELLDLRIAPDEQKLMLHNTQFVEHLLSCCRTAGCRRIVHLSTVYLQASIVWPNVHGREVEQFRQFREQCPFPAYCHSKFEAEESIRKAAKVLGREAIYSVIARVGPLYGEGDRRSLVCDAILFTHRFGAVPLVGDQGGTLQFTYAGNAAHALLHCAKKFFDEGLPIYGAEMVLISDKTPLKDIYRLLLEPIGAEAAHGDDDPATPNAVGHSPKPVHKRPIRIWNYIRFPFYVFYVLYLLVAIFVRPFTAAAAQMPGPYLFYILFRNWTFFSNFKLTTFFRFVPPFDWKTSFRRARRYYRQLNPDQIQGFSWVPSF
ncbi:hypothetical protein niasHT_037832 [Heterodera trifolii]|uniref:3-beta hydroxysteroid dehydrogenase/isomerase domain-containing protein n=1 Tax=Heterodera trifolii TaxID=157864 RepID=A0ABD2IQ77_9BILA